MHEIIYPHKSHNFTPIYKFGYNSNLHGSDFKSIWSQNVVYPWSAFDTAVAITAASDDGNDTDDLEIQGLDADYNLQTTTVTLTGLTPVNVPGTWKRVFRLRYRDTNNAGLILVKTGSTVVAAIEELENSSGMAIYTVPAGYTARMTNYTVSTSKGSDAAIRMKIRHAGDLFNTEHLVESFQNVTTQEFTKGFQFPQKTDIDFVATGTTTNGQVVVSFELLLERSYR